MKIRTYSELLTLPSFEDRFRYLKLSGFVGHETFGFDRYLNQQFYKSVEWRKVRNLVIMRDAANDLACPDHPIIGQVIIHHMNPITVDDIENNPEILLNTEYLICVSLETHNAIHYSDDRILKEQIIIDRKPGDTKLW